MKDNVIYYAVCRYVPDLLRDEFINIGVLTHIPDINWCKFHRTKNLSRVKNFDDEIELDVLKAILESLECQFNTSSNPTPPQDDVSNKEFLKKELVYYVNQVQFSEIRTLFSNDVKEDIRDLYDMYLYYDKKKSERINADRVKRLVSKMFKQSTFNKEVNRTPPEQNLFKQNPFDFSINLNGEETLIKALSFDYQQHNRFFNEIKSFLYDLKYFKDMDINNIKIVINNTDFELEHEKLAFELLNKETEVLTLEQFDDYLNKVETENNKQFSLFDFKYDKV